MEYIQATDQLVGVLHGLDPDFMDEFTNRCMEAARDSHKAARLFAAIIAAERQVNLSEARQLFFDDDGVLADLCRRGMTELLGFLHACTTKPAGVGTFSPSGFIDFFWHEFYCFDPIYVQFCLAIGCRRVMHRPVRASGQQDVGAETGRNRAIRQLRALGFQPNSNFWRDPIYGELCRDDVMPGFELCRDDVMRKDDPCYAGEPCGDRCEDHIGSSRCNTCNDGPALDSQPSLVVFG